MKTVDGIYTSAKIFTDNIEDYALAQIRQLCDQRAFQGAKYELCRMSIQAKWELLDSLRLFGRC